MDTDTRQAFQNLREDIQGIHKKIDEHTKAIDARCTTRGEQLAVLRDRAVQREQAAGRQAKWLLALVAVVTAGVHGLIWIVHRVAGGR